MVAKVIRITFNNGAVFDLPASHIAHSRASYLATREEARGEDFQKLYDKEYNYTLSHDDELIDWLYNNMNWQDFADRLIAIQPPTKPDYALLWRKQALEVTAVELPTTTPPSINPDASPREVYYPAMEITDEAEAKDYLHRIVQWHMARSIVDYAEALRIERSNLMLYAGHIDQTTVSRVYRLFCKQ